MSQRQWTRLDVVKRIEDGMLTVVEGAKVLGLSKRQVRRLRRAVRERGRDGVIHGLAGRPARNRVGDKVRKRLLRLWRTKYDGFNDHHFTEKLAEVEGMEISRSSVRRILRAEGIGAVRKRRPAKHRKRRDRKQRQGMMLLWDGSRHPWLEERGPPLCLMGAVDDATSELLPGAHFVEQECAAGYLGVLKAIAKEKGLPLSIYMDKHGSLRRNDDHWTLEEELRGEQDPTQVERAIKALSIELIYAHSPQAKGRVERGWGTHQDRLVSELRLAGAKTAAEANAVLMRYWPDHNRRFALAPEETLSAWRSVPPGTDLDRVCSFYYETTVRNDNTVRLEGVVIDIAPGPRQRSYAHARVELIQLLDGSWRVYHKDQIIATQAPTTNGELRAKKQRKRSAASRAFRAAMNQIAVSLP